MSSAVAAGGAHLMPGDTREVGRRFIRRAPVFHIGRTCETGPGQGAGGARPASAPPRGGGFPFRPDGRCHRGRDDGATGAVAVQVVTGVRAWRPREASMRVPVARSYPRVRRIHRYRWCSSPKPSGHPARAGPPVRRPDHPDDRPPAVHPPKHRPRHRHDRGPPAIPARFRGSSVPVLPSWLAEPLWIQLEVLLPERPAYDPAHPLGCHRPRVSDRIVFDKLLQVLRFGCSYDAIADTTCSAPRCAPAAMSGSSWGSSLSSSRSPWMPTTGSSASCLRTWPSTDASARRLAAANSRDRPPSIDASSA